jgi:acyl-CoA dehydrogenase family protein 9
VSREQSFMKAAFFGVVADDLVFPFPSLGEAEARRMRAFSKAIVRALDGHDPGKIDAARTIPAALLDKLRGAGAFGIYLSAEVGGAGLSTFGATRIVQGVAELDPAIALMLLTHGALGARAIEAFGTEAQKARHLPQLATGRSIAAFALTEHSSGSDAATIRTQAMWDEGASRFKLDGEKPWVSNGSIADVFAVFARTNRADEGNKPALTGFIVPKEAGVVVGEQLLTLGVRGLSVAPLRFERVSLERDQVLGEVGRGYRVAMAVLNDARISLAAFSFGQARAILQRIIHHVGHRRSFGRAIGEFPIIKDKIAKMMADCYAVESMIYLTAGLVDRKVEDYSLESAICRVASVESLWRVVNEALQVVAGRGYVEGGGFERALRDARVGFVVDGTNETLRCFIALSGLRGPGERLEVESALLEPLKGFGLLRRFAPRKMREALRRERIARAHPLLSREAVFFEEAIAELHEASMRVLREHGREIAEMQYTQKRLANTAIDLYALAACLSRTTLAIESRGESGARREIDLTTMFASAANSRMRAHLRRLEHNDDELRKLIAARTYTDAGYPFDVL